MEESRIMVGLYIPEKGYVIGELMELPKSPLPGRWVRAMFPRTIKHELIPATQAYELGRIAQKESDEAAVERNQRNIVRFMTQGLDEAWAIVP